MKAFILMVCSLGSSMAFSPPARHIARLTSNQNLVETIARTAELAHKRTIMKRGDDNTVLQILFDEVDKNDDSHIDGNEFATYFANANIEGLNISKPGWLSIYNLTVLERSDTNGNQMLEIDEFATLADYGKC